MRCGLVDIPCQLLAWFWALPWWVHWGLAACFVLALWGIVARLWSFAKGIGGWQAALAAVGALGLLLAAVWPRKARQVATDDLFPHPDGEKPIPRKKKPPVLRKSRETVQDWFKRSTGQ